MYRPQIIELLKSTARDGMDKMIEWLDDNEFFSCPASPKFHGAYSGGLAEHSFRVYEMLSKYARDLQIGAITGAGQKPLPIMEEHIIIAALLHDVCKVGAYLGDEAPYKWNRKQPKGHALLSIERIEKHIKLEEIERLMVLYHMGPYGCNEFYSEKDWRSGEYPLRGDHSKDDTMTKEESKAARYGKSMANAWYHNPICKLIYFCDEIETLQGKANHGKEKD
jgi:hypothetical protein